MTVVEYSFLTNYYKATGFHAVNIINNVINKATGA